MLQAKTAGYYVVEAQTSDAVMDLKSEPTYGAILKNTKLCYRYYVKEPDNDLRVMMNQYSGETDLYINPLSIPADLSKSSFFSAETFEAEEIVITPEMREKANALVGDWFICVFGRYGGSFRISASDEKKLPYVFLKTGVAETTYLELNETVNFFYRDSILKKKTNVTFQLHVNSGTAHIEVEKCVATEDSIQAIEGCALSENKLALPDPANATQYKTGAMTYLHDPKDCNNNGNWFTNMFSEPAPSCMYSIGVKGITKTHFGVTVTHEE